MAFGGNNTAGPLDVATACNAHGGPHGRLDFESETFVAHSLRADGFDASEDGTGRGTPLIAIQNATRGEDQNGLGVGGDTMFTLDGASQHAVAFEPRMRGDDGRGYDRAPHFSAESPTVNGTKPPAIAFESRYARNGRGAPDTIVPPLKAQSGESGRGDAAPLVAFSTKDHGGDASDISPTMRAGVHNKSHANAGVMPAVQSGMTVRRLTPRECERLQGFPDDWTAVTYRGKPAADGPRYRALGNSMAVPCMRWLGKRIEMVEKLIR